MLIACTFTECNQPVLGMYWYVMCMHSQNMYTCIFIECNYIQNLYKYIQQHTKHITLTTFLFVRSADPE
jgi:hypothetical protein